MSPADIESQNPLESFLVVGIGASAGGLEALQELFNNMPPDTGMCFVVVTHQHPQHVSILPELLSRETVMPVVKIEEGMKVEPNKVFVLGSGYNLTISGGILFLHKQELTRKTNLAIDVFFRSLAYDMHERAISIVLSGTGSDGTNGMKEIKAQGGMTLAQKPPSAKYAGMPASATGTGMVDFVETPAHMPQIMVQYTRTPYCLQRKEEGEFDHKVLDSILRFLRSRLGHDFSMYKSSTIMRRIQRRMSVHSINEPQLYLEYLHENRPEVQMLFSELLISVTSFFRDPEAFDALKEKILPELIKTRPDEREFRVWIAGCATGEEAYSLAIILDEIRQELKKPLEIRIFGTDLDDQAIQRARHGVYPASISVDVSQQRLERYFVPDGDDAYAVRKEIRDMLIFAPQNILSDPPFMKLEMLICRNVLIYLQSDLQKLLLPTFHYALNPGGILFLGSSESTGVVSELFDPLDARWKIYRRKEVSTQLPHLPAKAIKAEFRMSEETAETKSAFPPQTNRLIERLLLNRFAPVCIVVDRQGTIIYIHGRTGLYLEPEQQQPRNNIFEMAREGLRLPLSSSIHKAIDSDEEVVRRDIHIRSNSDYSIIDLSVSRILSPDALRGLLLIIINSSAGRKPVQQISKETRLSKKAPPERVVELEHELVYVRENNQTMIEELQSTNEELQSANEELQSTNEELQSSKEEMESLKEELSTVNNELNNKVQALALARDDMQNLLNSTDLAVIFLDEQLRVKRYTAKARSLINLRDTDIGRPVSDLTVKLKYEALLSDCTEVLDTLIRKEKEVVTRDNAWQLMRVLPYRTSENLIGGVVITFIDITRMKQSELYAKSVGFFRQIVNTVRQPLVLLNQYLQVQSANASFLDIFGEMEEHIYQKSIYELGKGQWDNPKLRNLFKEVLENDTFFSDFQIDLTTPRGVVAFTLNARRLKQEHENEIMILLAVDERT